jgi:hypothetical protein
VHQSQLELSVMADSKANIMITVCSILLSIAIAKMEKGELLLPLSMFAIGCVPALIFSILTVLPSSTPKHRGGGGYDQMPGFNPLFFIHFTLVPLKVFEREMSRILSDPEELYQALSRDIYYAGLVISRKKFRYLRWSYVSLLVGIAVSSVALVVELLT